MRMLTSTIEDRWTDAWNRVQLAQEEMYQAVKAYKAAGRLLRQRHAEIPPEERWAP